jgi:anti-anti-sigma factor
MIGNHVWSPRDGAAADRTVTVSDISRVGRWDMITLGPLSVRETREGGVHRFTPVGELDIATVPLLQSAFDAVFRDDDAEMIVVDLTELSFMDSSGIHLLDRMHSACGDADRLRVISGSRAVERILALAGSRAYLPIISSDRDPREPLRREYLARLRA